ELLASLFRYLRLRAALGGDVPRSGKHAQDAPPGVFVNGRVVEDVREMTIAVPDRQGKVCNETSRKHLLVAVASLLRFREVVGEVRPDQPLSWDAGHLYGRFVHVRDLPVRADRDEGVQ